MKPSNSRIKIYFLALILLILSVPQKIWAYAHEDCQICHGNRLGIGLAILTKERKMSTINPNTGKPLERIEAICLSCHSPQPGDIGYSPIADDSLQDDEGMTDNVRAATKLESSASIMADMMLAPVDVGFRVIDLHKTHPVGIVPRKVKLPADAKGFKGQEEQLTCMGCHNHHPSNPNYKYLRWPTDKGKNLNKFCSNCHPDKIKRAGDEKKRSRRRGIGDFLE